MKIRFSSALLLLPVSLSLLAAAFAQTPTPPATNPAQSAPAQAANTPPPNVPKMKIGIISMEAFRENLGDMRARFEKLQAEFAPVANELESMRSSIEAKQKTLESFQQGGAKMTPQQAQRLSEDIETLKRQFQRKTEDAQANYNKRQAEETAPVFDKVNQFMIQYAQKHGLTMVLEAGGLLDKALYADPRSNITEDFIREYNKANPVAASAAATPGAAPATTSATTRPTATGAPATRRPTGTKKP